MSELLEAIIKVKTALLPLLIVKIYDAPGLLMKYMKL